MPAARWREASGPSWSTRPRSAFLFSQVRTSTATPPVYAVNLVAAPAPTDAQADRAGGGAHAAAGEAGAGEAQAHAAAQGAAEAGAEAAARRRSPTGSRRRRPPRRSTPAKGETPSTGTDAATIKTPGLEFPFPEYLRNIVNQVYQRWDRDDARQNSFAEISFLIRRDGTVHDIRFVTRSGQLRLRSRRAGRDRGGGQLARVRAAARRMGCRRPPRELLLQAGDSMRRLLAPLLLSFAAVPLAAQDTTAGPRGGPRRRGVLGGSPRPGRAPRRGARLGPRDRAARPRLHRPVRDGRGRFRRVGLAAPSASRAGR